MRTLVLIALAFSWPALAEEKPVTPETPEAASAKWSGRSFAEGRRESLRQLAEDLLPEPAKPPPPAAPSENRTSK